MSLADLLKKGGLRGLANAKPANVAKHGPSTRPTLATLATIALAKARDTKVDDTPDNPDGLVRTGRGLHGAPLRLQDLHCRWPGEPVRVAVRGWSGSLERVYRFIKLIAISPSIISPL